MKLGTARGEVTIRLIRTYQAFGAEVVSFPVPAPRVVNVRGPRKDSVIVRASLTEEHNKMGKEGDEGFVDKNETNLLTPVDQGVMLG